MLHIIHIHMRVQVSEGHCSTAQPCTVVCAYIMRVFMRRQQHLNYKVFNLPHHSANMTFNGLLFCTACGNLLPRVSKAKTPQIACELCGTQTTSINNHIISKTTSTNLLRRVARPNEHSLTSNRLPIRPPTQARSLRHAAHLSRHCERTADHQRRMSIFYTCPKCSYKFNTNN
jgi:DNA-directed RNA polymerase subunit M/transcription elongation factor TFIIS